MEIYTYKTTYPDFVKNISYGKHFKVKFQTIR